MRLVLGLLCTAVHLRAAACEGGRCRLSDLATMWTARYSAAIYAVEAIQTQFRGSICQLLTLGLKSTNTLDRW